MLSADPVSSATYAEALEMAELIASQNVQWSIYRAKGASMGDYFGSHSLLLVKCSGIREVQEGMIVLYRSSRGEVVAHKVLRHRGVWLETAGVSNDRRDPVFVRANMVVGTVFGVIHAASIPDGPLYTSDGRRLAVAYCKN